MTENMFTGLQFAQLRPGFLDRQLKTRVEALGGPLVSRATADTVALLCAPSDAKRAAVASALRRAATQHIAVVSDEWLTACERAGRLVAPNDDCGAVQCDEQCALTEVSQFGRFAAQRACSSARTC